MDAMTLLHYVTRALAQSPVSREVYLFGSTARELREFVSDYVGEFDPRPIAADVVSDSNDLDLVITVKPWIYNEWTRVLNEKLNCVADCDNPSTDSYDGCKWIRFNLALKLLGAGTFKDSSPLYGWLHTLDELKELDLHLMPENWRSRSAELQGDLPHRDPLFVSNIARDAIWLTEQDTTEPYDWQHDLLNRLARLQSTQRSIGHAAVYSAVISQGLAGANPSQD